MHERLNRGASVRLTDCNGDTPLRLAAMQGHLAGISMLLDADALIDAPNRQGDARALAAIIRHARSQIAQADASDRSPLAMAIWLARSARASGVWHVKEKCLPSILFSTHRC